MKFPVRFMLLPVVFLFILTFILLSIHKANAFTAQHVVISQIQIGAAGQAHQEFVELYNPTENDINLSNWRLSRESSSSASFSNLVASLSGVIKAHGYFLIGHPEATLSADIVYDNTNNSISTNNTIILYSDQGITVVDKVGMGLAVDKEDADAKDPPNNKSIIRKASDISDASSLSIGGTEEHAGNGWDTDNNANDFVVIPVPMPRNSNSPASPLIPTLVDPTNTPVPSDTPTSSPSIIPTLTEIPTPTITSVPTNTPTETPVATNTPTPTAIPTDSPTSIPTVTPTNAPTPTMYPNPFPSIHIACRWHIRIMKFFGLTIHIPTVSCVVRKQ